MRACSTCCWSGAGSAPPTVPRAMHAELLTNIAKGRPLAIAMDVIFDTPSARGPDDDRALGEAVARAGNVILGAAMVDDLQSLPHLNLGYDRVTLNYPIPAVR